MDKVTEDLEDAARRRYSKILYWHVNKLRGSSQSGLVPVKDRNGAWISDKERVKERWVEYFECVLNWDTVAEKDIEEKDFLWKRFVLWQRISDSTKWIKT